MELRCGNKLHGIIGDDGVLEVRCTSRFCGAGNGVVVVHRFDLHSNDMTTLRFKSGHPEKGEANGSGRAPAAVRTP